jgi:transglutaminase-like putative cysteine protease
VLYDIGLRITYTYASPAAGGRHLLRMMPADLPNRQRLVAGHLSIEPRPDEQANGIDFFGNATVECAHRSPHTQIRFEVQARVNRTATVISPEDNSPDRATLAREIAGHRGVGRQAPVHFIGPSPRVPTVPEISAYARQDVPADATALATVRAIGEALHTDMRFVSNATTVDTPIAEAFAARHGVCQDFSHIMIAALRAVGVPAGYVSGFLRTKPPEGKPRLEGADAMHAWVRAWCGNAVGWVEYDPTNGVFVAADHIVIARGRDYSDVAPVKGVLRGSGGQRSSQAVDVIPRTGSRQA